MFLPWSILPESFREKRKNRSPADGSKRKVRRRPSVEPLEDRVVPATFFVDVTNPNIGTGTLANPFKHLQDAIRAATLNPGSDDIIVYGNSSGNPQHVYVWTRDGDRNGDGIQDGNLVIAPNDRLIFRAQTLLQAPVGSPAPVIVKLANNFIDVSNNATLRVEGSAVAPVIFTSLQDDAAGGDTNGDGNISQPQRLDWGGIRFRGGAVPQGPTQASGSFFGFADIRYTGATLFDSVSGQNIEFASIRMEYDGTNAVAVRVWDTTFRHGGKALDVHFKALAGTGPDIGAGGGAGPGQGAAHPLTFIDNSINGLFVNIPFVPVIPDYDVDSTWDDIGTPYVLTQRLKLNANLTIEPGMVIKVQNNAIEDVAVTGSNQFQANGTPEKPVLFTALTDDDMGILAPFYNNGSADTNNDGPGTPQPGDWGGLTVRHGNIDYGIIRYGGGEVPDDTGFFRDQVALAIQSLDLRPFGPLQTFRLSNTEITRNRGINTPIGALPTVDIYGNGLITVIDNWIHDNQGAAIRGHSSTYGTIYHPLGGYGIHYRRNRLERNAINGVFTTTIGGTGYLDDTDITHVIGDIVVGAGDVRQIQSRREAIPYVDITNPSSGDARDYLRRFQGQGLGNAGFTNFIAQLQGQGINQGPFTAFPGDNGLFFRFINFETTSRGVAVPGVAPPSPGNLRGDEWRDFGVNFTANTVGGLFPLKTLNVGAGAISATNIITTADTSTDDSSMTLTFPNMVSAVGFWVVNNPNSSAAETIEFYGDQGQLLETIPLPSTSGGPVFVGRISKAPIHRIVIRENASDGDLMGLDNLYFVDASESLVVKMVIDPIQNLTGTIQAGGFDGIDVDPDTGQLQVGGTLRVLGQPDAPVILTVPEDDTAGAGPVGAVVFDVTGDGNASNPSAGGWTGIRIEPGANTATVEYVAQRGDGTIVRRHSDRNPYTIGDETDLNPALSSIPDTLTRRLDGVSPPLQNVQDGTLIEHAHIRYATVGIDSINYPAGKLVIEGQEVETNDNEASANIVLPYYLTDHMATRYGARSFRLDDNNYDLDFFRLINTRDLATGNPNTTDPIPIHVDIDRTGVIPNPPRQYNIFVFNAFNQLVYLNGPNFGNPTNFLGPILEMPGDVTADFANDPLADWDAEYVVITPVGVVPRVLVPDTIGGRLAQGQTFVREEIPGGEGFLVRFADQNGFIDTPEFSDFMSLPGGSYFGNEGYEVEFRLPLRNSANTDVHFGQAADAIRLTGDPVTIIENGVPVQYFPTGGMVYRNNLITNSATAGIRLRDHTVDIPFVGQTLVTQSGRYFYPNRDVDTGTGSQRTNPNNYLPGANVYNNVIANNAGHGIQLVENNPLNPAIPAATGYHQIINNTIHNNAGNGIDLITKGGPNVLNNIITKNNIGVRVQDLGYPGATTVVNYNLFHQNSVNIQGPTNGANNLLNLDPLYVDPDRLDLRVYARPSASGTSPAVDAALSNLADRLFAMRHPDVPTRAPNDDFRNRRRNDNPVRSNTGAGQFPFYDIGAYETNEEPLRVLSLSLFTANGIVPGPVSGFTVQFAGRVDPTTVNSQTVRVRLGTVNQPIGTISNSYDPVRDIHTFTFTFTNPLGAGNYTILMDGTSTSATDPAIRDIAGQLLDGEFPPPATAPNFSFPSGNNVPGGDFNYAFTVVVSSIGDLVWNDVNGDGIKQAAEPGLSNVTVQLRTPGPDGIPGTADDVLIASTVTNASGNYGFTNLTPGIYIVDVLNSTLPPNFANTNPPRPKIVNLGVGEARMDVDFGFRLDLQNASIGDLVWNDLNGDGIRQPGEPGIGGVRIDLVGSGPDLTLGTADDVTFPPQFTNAVGAYNFINLPAWTYRVTVDITSPPLAGFGLTTGNNPLVVTLNPGQAFTAADFGFVLKNSSIGDLVWDDLNGNGVFDSGEPGIPSVTVFIDLNNNGTLDTGEPAATTDATGNYTIPSLAPGTYRVRVDFSTLPPGYVPTTTHPLTVNLGPNDNRTDVDFGFRLDPQNAQLGGLVFSDVFGNGVFDGPDTGLTGINILLTWAGLDGIFGTADDQNFGPYTTGAGGSWTSPASLPSGTYRVLVQNPPAGHVQTTPGGNPQTVTLGISQVKTDVDFGFQQRQASIGDRVWHDLDLDGNQDPGEPGLNGVFVRLRYAGPDGILDTSDDVLFGPITTSGDGNYTFAGLGAGLYRVTVDPNSPPLAGKGPTTPNPLLISLAGGSPGDSVTNADFGWVSANGAIGDRVFNDLSGDGVQQAGEIGIAGVRVFLDLNNNGIFDVGTDVERITNAFGFYQFTGLLAGTYRVIVDTSTLPGGTTPTIPNPPDVTVTLATDEVRSNVDFGFLLPPGTPGGVFYLTLKGGNTLTNSDGSRLNVTDTDIVRLVVATDGSWTYSLYFRGSDFGLSPGTESIDAFTFLPDGDILLSIKGAFSVKRTYTAPKQGSGSKITGNGEDILRFRPTGADANGRITAGSYLDASGTSTGLFFRGSRFGLSGSAENVDALGALADGRILISTKGVATVPGLANVQPQDIMAFNPANGTWSLYFRGSNAFLSGSAENVTAIALSDPAAALPTVYLSTNGNFAVPGLSGQRRDIFGFVPSSLGPSTSGTYLPSLTLQGGSYGMMTTMAITGMWLGVAPGSFPVHALGHATLPESNVGNLRWFEADGQINVWIDFSGGLLSGADAERIRDALTYLSTVSIASGGPSLVEVTDASLADVRITMQPGSTLGGPGSGVLATTQLAYDFRPSGTLANGEPFRRLLGHEFGRMSEITLVHGWNWYVGADSSGIAADQYDLQSVVLHELGHTLGLHDNAVDSTSAMFESLASGQIRRSLGNSDLAAVSSLYAEGAVLGGSTPPSGSANFPGSEDGDALVYTMVNGPAVPVAPVSGGQGVPQRGKEAKKQAATAKLQDRRDRETVDILFGSGNAGIGQSSKLKKVKLDESFWKELVA